VLDKSPAEREAILAGLSPKTREKLKSVLSAFEPEAREAAVAAARGESSETMDQPRPAPAGLLAGPSYEALALGAGVGTKIDRYKLLQLIGEGGFGSVFMAEQMHPVRRKVAVKVIKLG